MSGGKWLPCGCRRHFTQKTQKLYGNTDEKHGVNKVTGSHLLDKLNASEISHLIVAAIFHFKQKLWEDCDSSRLSHPFSHTNSVTKNFKKAVTFRKVQLKQTRKHIWIPSGCSSLSGNHTAPKKSGNSHCPDSINPRRGCVIKSVHHKMKNAQKD